MHTFYSHMYPEKRANKLTKIGVKCGGFSLKASEKCKMLTTMIGIKTLLPTALLHIKAGEKKGWIHMKI